VSLKWEKTVSLLDGHNLRMLHDRTQLENLKNELDMSEKIQLTMYELILLKKSGRDD
jgi:hypothetical protein